VIEYQDNGDSVQFTCLTPIEFTGFLDEGTPYSITWVATKGRAALIPDLRTYENSMRVSARQVFWRGGGRRSRAAGLGPDCGHGVCRKAVCVVYSRYRDRGQGCSEGPNAWSLPV